MRQKDVDSFAIILGNEMKWADECEVEGLKSAIGAVMREVGWAQPELDMSFMREALDVIPLDDSERLFDQAPRIWPMDESHIVRGED